MLDLIEERVPTPRLEEQMFLPLSPSFSLAQASPVMLDPEHALTPRRLEQEYGMPLGNQMRFQKVAQLFNVVIDVRPTNPSAVVWLEDGAVAKPEKIKAKTINRDDLAIGGPDRIGLVGFFRPREPELDGLAPGSRKRVLDRYAQRLEEYSHLEATFDKLSKEGTYSVVDGIVLDTSVDPPREITADHDIFDIRHPNGDPVTDELYDHIVWSLMAWRAGVQHGAHMYWKPTDDFGKAMFKSIVTRHQRTTEGAEPLIRFSPVHRPTLVYAEPS
jgi:hypothetical protein